MRVTGISPRGGVHTALVESGAYLAGGSLELPDTGTTVRIKGGNRRVQDGPYADTK